MGDYVLDRGPRVPASVASRWWLFLLLGLASVVIGVILLLDLVVAVETLALLVAFGLIFSGLEEILGSGRYRTAWSIAGGVLLVVSGIVAAAWPDITLWALALVAAFGLLLSGMLRIGAALGDRPDGWGWLLAGGLLSVAVGIMALVWPGATVLVLAILLGIRLVVYGAVEIAFALTVRDFRPSTA